MATNVLETGGLAAAMDVQVVAISATSGRAAAMDVQAEAISATSGLVAAMDVPVVGTSGRQLATSKPGSSGLVVVSVLVPAAGSVQTRVRAIAPTQVEAIVQTRGISKLG